MWGVCIYSYNSWNRYCGTPDHRSPLFNMMTSSNASIFRVTDPLCGEFTGHRWIPLIKASDAELWCFLPFARINDWVNNRETGDLRRYRTHYDVTVMSYARLSSGTWMPHDDVIKWNIFRVTGHLCGEFTGLRWIPRTKASDAGLWCFLSSASE